MQPQHPGPPPGGPRIVICDYNALLLSVTGLLRMSGYAVFQAHDGWAARELCVLLPHIDLLVLNTYGTGIDVGELCRNVRSSKRGLPILHIGSTSPPGLPSDVPTLSEEFTADSLLLTVQALIEPGLRKVDPVQHLTKNGERYPNGRRWEDQGSRSGLPWGEPFSAPLQGAAPVRPPTPIRTELSWARRMWHFMTSGRPASGN
jgi:CheY-like chemotaxis protein